MLLQRGQPMIHFSIDHVFNAVETWTFSVRNIASFDKFSYFRNHLADSPVLGEIKIFHYKYAHSSQRSEFQSPTCTP